ncbi:MAG: MFS transporter [Pseudomonadota bacterium]
MGPFRYAAFAVLWSATVVSNIGTWMQSAAAGWLMTSIDASPSTVAMVQVASSVPMMLFAIPSGALADLVDRRRLLLLVQIVSTVLIAALASVVWLGRVTPFALLAFTFLLGVTSVLVAPAWQSIVSQLVPPKDLGQAIALNSAGVNISRAIGPALAGLVIVAWGLAAPFWLNAVSNIGVILALIWWRAPVAAGSVLPRERMASAMRIGLRYARYNVHLRATMVRAAAFFTFAGAYWALLPLVAREQIAGGPQLYGILLGAIGIGAVVAAFALPRLKERFDADRLVVAGSFGTVIALLLFGVARDPVMALVACVIAGLSWITVLATLNVAAQLSLPAWVRGRGLATFVTVQFAAMTVGSLTWGYVADKFGLSVAHYVAAGGLLVLLPLLRRWRLETTKGLDLAPSMHWPAPVLSQPVEVDRGPVLVTIEYRVTAGDRDAFLKAIAPLEHERRRDGAFEWFLFEDAAEAGRFVETFMLNSWIEHLRQHERATNADRVLQERVGSFHATGAPKVTHLIAIDL